MVTTGQHGISLVDFASRLHPRLPVEVVERSELFARVALTAALTKWLGAH